MKICAYSTSNEAYLRNAVVSLLSVQKWNPEVDLFILSRKVSEEAKLFTATHNISIIELNLDHLFSKEFSYPIECYYLFAGPEYFFKQGYDYSIYIDGDIYCNNPIDIAWHRLEYYAGTSYGRVDDLLKNDLETIYNIWGYKEIPKQRIQTGVLYFNNQNLAKISFLDKLSELYLKSIENIIPRRGDDSLFSLFQLLYPRIKPLILSQEFNLILFWDTTHTLNVDYLRYLEEQINQCVFFHFTLKSPKPWLKVSKFSCYTEKFFYEKWQDCCINSLSKDELKIYFPQFTISCKFTDLRFYWWGDANVGDLVTKYFLTKVCKIEAPEILQAKDTDFTKIKKSDCKTQISAFFARRLSIILNNRSRRKLKLILSTGSVMRLCSPGVTVYGSGIRNRNQELNVGTIKCVRGPLTRQALLKIGCECPPIYGDPGLLISRYYRPKFTKEKRILGIIPHFTEYDDVLKLYLKETGVRVINMGSGDIEDVIEQIVACSAIVSSSLHGIIFANSYSIPVRWIKFSNRVFGDDTKFYDHFLSIGRTNEGYIDAFEFKYISIKNLLSLISPYDLSLNLDKLQDALFFDRSGLKPSVLSIRDNE